MLLLLSLTCSSAAALAAVADFAAAAAAALACIRHAQAYSKEDGYDEALTAEAATTHELERALGESSFFFWGGGTSKPHMKPAACVALSAVVGGAFVVEGGAQLNNQFNWCTVSMASTAMRIGRQRVCPHWQVPHFVPCPSCQLLRWSMRCVTPNAWECNMLVMLSRCPMCCVCCVCAAVELAKSKSSGGGVQLSFNQITPKSAVVVVRGPRHQASGLGHFVCCTFISDHTAAKKQPWVCAQQSNTGRQRLCMCQQLGVLQQLALVLAANLAAVTFLLALWPVRPVCLQLFLLPMVLSMLCAGVPSAVAPL